MDRYEDRKEAMSLHGNANEVETDQIRVLLSGLDLDVEELANLSLYVAHAALTGLRHGVPLPGVMKGAWVDGLVTGILLQEARGK